MGQLIGWVTVTPCRWFRTETWVQGGQPVQQEADHAMISWVSVCYGCSAYVDFGSKGIRVFWGFEKK